MGFHWTLVISFLAVTATTARSQSWINPQSGVFNDGTNWSGGVVPTSSALTALTFGLSKGNGSYIITNNFGAPFLLNSINFAHSAGGSLTISTNTGSSLRFVPNGGTAPSLNLSGSRYTLIATAASGTDVELTTTTNVTGAGAGDLELRSTFGAGGLNIALGHSSASFGLGRFNSFTGSTTLQSGNLILTDDAGLGNAANTLTYNSGTLILQTSPSSTTRTIAQNIISNSVSQPLTIRGTGNSSDTLTLQGAISGVGGLTYDSWSYGSLLLSTPTLSLGSANTYAGNTNILRSNITLFGPQGAISNSPVITLQSGGLVLANTSNNNPNRINDNARIIMHNGVVNLAGSFSASSSETISFTGNAASDFSGQNTFRISGGTSNVHTLTLNNFVQGNLRATAVFDSDFLGAVGFNQINVGTGLVSNLVGGGGSMGSTTTSILPWAYQAGSFSSNLVTVSNTGQIQALSSYANDLYFLSGTTTQNNVRLNTQNPTIREAMTIGSLTLSSTSTLNSASLAGGGNDLVIQSGVILYPNNNGTTGSRATLASKGIQAPAGVPITIHNPSGILDVYSPFTSQNGGVFSSGTPTAPLFNPAINLNVANPAWSGNLTLNNGQTNFYSLNAISGLNQIELMGGSLRYTGATASLLTPLVSGPANLTKSLRVAEGSLGVAASNQSLTLGGYSGPGGLITTGDPGIIRVLSVINATGPVVVTGASRVLVNDDTMLSNTPSVLLENNGGGYFGYTGSNPGTIARPFVIGSQARFLANTPVTLSTGIRELTVGTNAGFEKLGSGELTLSAANFYKGTTTVSAGTLTLSGNGDIITSSSAIIRGNGTLRLDNTLVNNNDRVSSPLAFYGGRFELIGNAASTFEDVGALSFFDGFNTVSVTPATGTTANLISQGNIGYFIGQSGYVLFSGKNLGVAVPESTRIFISNAGFQNIVQGKLLSTFGFDGTNYGMATYDVTGVRLLTAGEYVSTLAASGSASNTRMTSLVTTATKTINSLTLDSGGGIDSTSTGILTVHSGDILALPGNLGINGGSLRAFDSNVGLSGSNQFHILTAGNLAIGATLDKSSIVNSLRKSGPGTLTLYTPAGGSPTNAVRFYSVDEGTLAIQGTSRIPTNSVIFVNPGAALDVTANNLTLSQVLTINTSSSLGVTPATVTLADKRLTISHVDGTDMSFVGNFTGTTGGLILEVADGSNVGNMRFSSALQYTGNTELRQGRITFTRDVTTGSTFLLGDAASTRTVELRLGNMAGFNHGDLSTFANPISIVTNANQSAIISTESSQTNIITLNSNVNLGSNNVTLRATGPVAGEAQLIQQGTITGTGRVRIDGNGIVNLSSTTNNFSGGVEPISSLATLEITNSNSLGTGLLRLNGSLTSSSQLLNRTTALNLANGIDVSNGNFVLNVLTPSAISFQGAVSLAGNLNASVIGGQPLTLSGNITGAGALTKSGGGVLQLDGNNNFVGGMTFSDGALQLSSNTALGTGTFSIGFGFNTQVLLRSLNSARTIANPVNWQGDLHVDGTQNVTFTGTTDLPFLSPNITVWGPSLKVEFAGRISSTGGNLGITKNGTGRLDFSNPTGNTYKGPTIVSQGLLVVNNTSGSGTGIGTVSVQSGTTLGGNAIIVPNQGSQAANLVTIDGTITPGNSVGAMTIGSAANLATVNLNGNYNFELATTGNSAPVNTGGSSATASHDTMTVNGVLNLGSNWRLNPTFTGVTFNDTVPYSWTIATATGGINGSASNHLGTATNFPLITGGTLDLSIINGGTQLVLNFTPVPEPVTILGIAALGTFAYRQVRRKA